MYVCICESLRTASMQTSGLNGDTARQFVDGRRQIKQQRRVAVAADGTGSCHVQRDYSTDRSRSARRYAAVAE